MAPSLFLLHLNAIAGVASAIAAVVALRDPSMLSHTPAKLVSTGETFYRNLFAARALPFGVVVAIVPYYYRQILEIDNEAGNGNLVVGWFIGAAGLVQAADVAIAAQRSEFGVIVGAGAAALLHFVTALSYL